MPAAKPQSSVPHLTPGVYTPLPTFFDDNEELDLLTYRKHLLHVVGQGVLPVCAGSLGEAVHLTREERIKLVQLTREALDEEGYGSVPIVAGVGGACTRETVQLAKDAAAAGATVGMVIPPAYYAATLQQDTTQIEQYYIDICRLSPIPLLLYNFPANSAGQDLTSETIQTIIANSPNLCGVKLTCPGRLEKLTHITSSLAPTRTTSSFLILDGVMNDLPTWQQHSGHGTVSGISNIAPATTVRLWELCCVNSRSEDQETEMQELLSVLSKVDAVIMPLGVRGLKYALGWQRGYGNNPRRPLLPLEEKNGKVVQGLLEGLKVYERKYE